VPFRKDDTLRTGCLGGVVRGAGGREVRSQNNKSRRFNKYEKLLTEFRSIP